MTRAGRKNSYQSVISSGTLDGSIGRVQRRSKSNIPEKRARVVAVVASRAREGKRDDGRIGGRHRGPTIKGATTNRRGRGSACVPQGPASVDTRVGTRRAEKSTGTGKPGGYRGRRAADSRTPPIFHEVVTPDGLSLSGCLLYPSRGRKSSVKSLRPASSCLPSPTPPPSRSPSHSGPQKKAFCRSGLAVRSNVSRSTVRWTDCARGCAASGRYT